MTPGAAPAPPASPLAPASEFAPPRGEGDAPAGWGSPRAKTVTWYDPARTVNGAAGRSGLEFVTALRDGQVPPPPIAFLQNMRLRDVEPGVVVFECAPDESMYNPLGTVHGGVLCTLADTVVGCAVQTTLEAGTSFTSIDITVNYLRPVTLASGTLLATGRVTKPGRRVAFAAAEVHDQAGRLVATATSSCLIIRLDESAPRQRPAAEAGA